MDRRIRIYRWRRIVLKDFGTDRVTRAVVTSPFAPKVCEHATRIQKGLFAFGHNEICNAIVASTLTIICHQQPCNKNVFVFFVRQDSTVGVKRCFRWAKDIFHLDWLVPMHTENMWRESHSFSSHSWSKVYRLCAKRNESTVVKVTRACQKVPWSVVLAIFWLWAVLYIARVLDCRSSLFTMTRYATITLSCPAKKMFSKCPNTCARATDQHIGTRTTMLSKRSPDVVRWSAHGTCLSCTCFKVLHYDTCHYLYLSVPATSHYARTPMVSPQ